MRKTHCSISEINLVKKIGNLSRDMPFLQKKKKLWFNFFLSCGKDSCFLWCINGVHGKLLSEWSRDSFGRLAVLTHLWSRWIHLGPGASYCAFICKIWELIFNSFQLQTFFIIVEGNCFFYRLKTLVTFV